MKKDLHYSSEHSELRDGLREVLGSRFTSFSELESAVKTYLNKATQDFQGCDFSRASSYLDYKLPANDPQHEIKSIWDVPMDEWYKYYTSKRPVQAEGKNVIIPKQQGVSITKETFIGPPVYLMPYREWYIKVYFPQTLNSFEHLCYELLGKDWFKFQQAIIDGREILVNMLAKGDASQCVTILNLGGKTNQEARMKHARTRVIPVLLYLHRIITHNRGSFTLALVPIDNGPAALQQVNPISKDIPVFYYWLNQYMGPDDKLQDLYIRIGYEYRATWAYPYLKTCIVHDGEVTLELGEYDEIPVVNTARMYPNYSLDDPDNNKTDKVKSEYRKYASMIRRRVDYREV